MKKDTRNGAIDFWRFIFAVLVVLNHAINVFHEDATQELFRGFSYAVEFFFLVSGYLLMASIEKAERTSRLPLAQETGSFLLKKYKSVFPEVLVAYIIGVAVVVVATGCKVRDLLMISWFEPSLIVQTGLGSDKVMPQIWYISSMLLCMVLMYPFIRRYKKWATLILPVLGLLALGYILQNTKSIRNPRQWLEFTHKGNLRAFGELSLGMLCYYGAKKLKEMDFTVLGRVLLSAVELGLYAQCVRYMALGHNHVKDITYLVFLSAAIIISFSQQGIGAKLFQNKLCFWLGKYSLSLFVGHYYWAEYLEALIPGFAQLRQRYQLGIYLAAALLSGLVIMLISAGIRKVGPAVARVAKRCIVKEKTAV